MIRDGSAWVTLRVYEAGAGMGPKSLLAAFSFQSPEKLGLSAAMAITARAAIRRATFESDFMGAPSDMTHYWKSKHNLFVAECDSGVDVGGAACRDPASQQRDCGETEGHRNVGEGIARADVEQESGHHAGQGQGRNDTH